jgi:hypothetical protein
MLRILGRWVADCHYEMTVKPKRLKVESEEGRGSRFTLDLPEAAVILEKK